MNDGRVPPAWYVAALGLALLLGGAAAVRPALAVAGLIGIALAALVVANITVGLILFVAVAALESLPTLQGAPSTAKAIGVFLVVGWALVAAFGVRDAGWTSGLASFAPALVGMIVLFLAWVLFSLLWAEDPAVAQETFVRLALNFVLFPIVFLAIRTPRHVGWLCWALLAGGLTAALVGFVAPTQTDDAENRLGGAGLNPNELGSLLATGAVLAVVLACNRRLSLGARAFALSASFLCLIALVLSGTRGAVVGIVAAMAVAPVLAGPGRRVATFGFVAVAFVSMLVWLVAFTPSSSKRLLDFSYADSSGRSDIWTIAFRMIDDKPVAGVGAGNFPVSSVHYLLAPGTITRSEYIVDTPKQTHNIFLQVLAELGIVGLGLFLGIIGYCSASYLRAARTFRRAGDWSMEVVSRGMLVALLTLLISSAFTTELYSKQMFVLLAAGPTLFAMARRALVASRAETGPTPDVRATP